MARLLLSAPLVELLPADERPRGRPPSSVPLDAESWPDLAWELRRRFPLLATRVLTESGGVAAGFVLIVNDQVKPRADPSLRFSPKDEICLIAALAGG